MNFLDIPFSQAFAHAISEPSYLITFILLNLVGILSLIFGIRYTNKTGKGQGIYAGIVIFILCAALSVIRPFNIAGATSPEQAERGVFIGW